MEVPERRVGTGRALDAVLMHTVQLSVLPPSPADHPVTGQSQDPGVLLRSRAGGGLGEVPAASEPVLIMRPWPHLVGRSGLMRPPSVS